MTRIMLSHVKDQLNVWFDRLSKHNCTNYLVIHATFQDKAALLHKFSMTRVSMSERIRNDFGSQRADKTITFKAESNSIATSQSWLISVGKIRDSIIKSVTVKLAAMEKSVNQIRDTHEEEDFNLFKYIEAKEHLTLLYELTGLYEEAYRSGEEVLSLFRQYVFNLRQCQIVPWIEEFIERDITNWSGLSLESDLSIKDLPPQQVNSIQLCSLIFRRIAYQLIALQNPRDLANKGLGFLLQTVQECSILKAKYPRGALVVWVYISCIEILEAVKKSSPLNNMDVPEPLAVAKGQLYNLAREKLYELGRLAGHLTDDDTVLSDVDIEQLIEGSKPVSSTLPPPRSNITADLHKILTDKAFFHKQYIDLCQLSIVSFKQGAWTRHAQMIMMRQALYLRHRGLQSECLNAETHLRDVCHAYSTQGWHRLATYCRIKLCDVQHHLGLLDRELTTCCHLSTEQDHNTLTDRQTYSKRLIECVTTFNEEKRGDQILIPFHPLLQHEIRDCDNADSSLLSEEDVRVKSTIQLSLILVNSSTEPISQATVSLNMDTGKELLNRSKSVISETQDFSMVPIESNSEILEDGLYGISLKADNELMTDERSRVGETSHSLLLSSQPLILLPGKNEVVISAVPAHPGAYGISSIQVQVGCVIFRQKNPLVPSWLETIEVENEASSVKVDVVQPPSGVWISDKPQYCILSIWTEKAFHSLTITLKTPEEGLQLTAVENGTYSIEDEEEQGVFSLERIGESWNLTLPALLPRKLIRLPVPVIGHCDQHIAQHLLRIFWSGSSMSLILTFYQPFVSEIKYRYQGDEIYLICLVTSNLPADLRITQCRLDKPGSFENIVPFSEQKLAPKQIYSNIWRMSKSSGLFPREAQVAVEYCLPFSDDRYTFEVPVTVFPKDPHISVSVNCLTEVPREGETCQFEVVIQAERCEVKSEEKRVWRLLYGVGSPRGEWAVCGEKRRQVDITDTVSLKVELFALAKGRLEYPKVVLWEYRESQLQTTGNSRDLLYINADEPSQSDLLTPLSSRESDPLMVRSTSTSRKRSVSTMPRAERIDYSTGKQRIKVVTSIVLNTLTDENIVEIPPSRLCLNNSLSLIEVAPA